MFLFLEDVYIKSASPPDTAEQAGEIDVLAYIKKALSGDSDSFGVLVSHYERFVYGTACKVLSGSGVSLDSADDIAQDAFIKAWRNLSSFRGDCTFSTWLYRITVNTAKDALRSASASKTVSLTQSSDDGDDCEWDIPVTSGDSVPEDAIDRRETILAVRKAIEELPGEQRAVVVLRDLYELSYTEIFEKLGVELGTVKSRLSRGRQNLKEILKNGNFL